MDVSVQNHIKDLGKRRASILFDMSDLRRRIDEADKRKTAQVRDMAAESERLGIVLRDCEEAIHDMDRLDVVFDDLVKLNSAIAELCAQKRNIYAQARLNGSLVDSQLRAGFSVIGCQASVRLGY